MTKYDLAFWAFAVVGAGYVAYLVGGHGVPWVWGKVKSVFGHAKADLAALEGRVAALEKSHVVVPQVAPVGPIGPTGAAGH